MEDDGHPPDEGEPMPLLPGEIVSPAAGEFELVCDIWSADAHMGREHARQAAAIAELARRRSAGRDADHGPRGGPGPDAPAMRPAALADVSDDFVTELALIRTCSEAEAGRLAAESILLTTKLAATWAELFAGRLTVREARILLDLLGDAPEAGAAEVQARVLPGAEDCPPSRLGDRARYHLYRVDAEAKERRRTEAERRADVHVERTADDLGRLVAEGPLPAVHAARDAVDRYARWMRADGDDRPIGLLRASAALDLILRPWDTSRPPVTAHLVVHASAAALGPDAPAGAPPAEVDGQLITAAQCRELLASLGMLGAAPAGGSVRVAVDARGTGGTVAVATRAELRCAAGRGRSVRRRDSPHGAHPHGAHPHGAHPPGEPDGPGLRPPPPTGRYRPTAAQQRLVTVRDRHCRRPCTPTDSSSCAPPRVSPGPPALRAGATIPSPTRPGSTSSHPPSHSAPEPGRSSARRPVNRQWWSAVGGGPGRSRGPVVVTDRRVSSRGSSRSSRAARVRTRLPDSLTGKGRSGLLDVFEHTFEHASTRSTRRSSPQPVGGRECGATRDVGSLVNEPGAR